MAALATASLAACGGDSGDDDETKVRDVVAQLQQASRSGDGELICDDLFTDNLKVSVARASNGTCAKEVATNVTSDSAAYDVTQLDVGGDTATAKIVDDKDRRLDLLFERDGDNWRIARIAGAD